jgi:predicted acylesterase/phospholipase RssA
MTSIDNPTKIKHIVCSGGGVTGFSFYGVLRESNRAGIWNFQDIETISGTSVGSIIAVIIALNYDWEILDDFLIKRPWHHVFKITMYTIFEALNKRGIFNMKTIEETFLPLFNGKDISVDITMLELYEMTKKDVHIFITEVHSMETIDISYKTHPEWRVVDAVYASSSVPVLFEPFIKADKCYCDGGFLLNYPLRACLDKGIDPDEVLGIRRISCTNTSAVDSSDNQILISDTITESSTLLDYLMVIFNKLVKMIIKPPIITIKNEYRVVATPLSILNICNAITNMEERIRLIKIGSDLVNLTDNSTDVS